MATKPKHQSDHEENRLKVCAVCGSKIVFGSNPQSKFIIGKNLEALIKKYSNDDFDVLNLSYPKSICTSCKVSLYERKQGKFSRSLPRMPDYLNSELSKESCSHDNHACCCYICSTGRLKSHKKTVRGKAKTTLNENSEVNRPTVKICNLCFAEIAKGKSHVCNQNVVHKNMIAKIETLPEKTKDNILHKLLVTKAKTSDPSTNLQNVRVILNPRCEKEILFTEEKLDNFLANTGVTLNQMEQFTNFIRSTAGKKTVPPYYRNHASKKAKILEDVYYGEIHEFDVEKLQEKEARPVVYADAEDLLDAVLEARKQYGEVIIKLMADGGKGFFKISMSILPKDHYEDTSDVELEPTPPKKKRRTYEEGETLGKKANLNGVNRLILVCVVPNIKETYDNIKILWNLTNLNKIPFKFVSDYKLLLIVIGQQTATSTYPCPFCFITLDVLRSGEVGAKMPCFQEGDVELQISEECLKLKTFGEIKASYDKFTSLNCNKKLAKNCHSTINLPLFDESDDMPVIEKVIIPELHEIQGIVNHIFFDGLVPLLGKENAMKWPKKLNLISKHYHGEKFEGNACRRMLKESDILTENDILQDTPIFKIIPYVQTLKCLNKLVDASFKSDRLDKKWQEHLNELKRIFPATGLSTTLKVHVLLEHLEHGLHFLNGESLGFWSEQAGESVHREFLKYWSKYQNNNLESENYIERLKKAVVEFSSRNL